MHPIKLLVYAFVPYPTFVHAQRYQKDVIASTNFCLWCEPHFCELFFKSDFGMASILHKSRYNFFYQCQTEKIDNVS